jgi:hypothetical protein
MSETNPAIGATQTCNICGVKILKLMGNDRVIFATGAHATRDVLWQKVCQHVKDRPGCLNPNPGS